MLGIENDGRAIHIGGPLAHNFQYGGFQHLMLIRGADRLGDQSSEHFLKLLFYSKHSIASCLVYGSLSRGFTLFRRLLGLFENFVSLFFCLSDNSLCFLFSCGDDFCRLFLGSIHTFRLDGLQQLL